jgi:serine/threonine-protein kinase HipA
MDHLGNWTPSPAYDITFATHPLATNLRSASVMGRFSGVSRNDLTELGNDQGIRRIDDTIGRVLTAIKRWPEFASEAGIPEPHAKILAAEFPATSW